MQAWSPLISYSVRQGRSRGICHRWDFRFFRKFVASALPRLYHRGRLWAKGDEMPQPDKGGGRVPPPICKAFLLCNYALIERGSNRPSIIGVIDSVPVSFFPTRIPQMCAFIQLVDGIGQYEIALEFQDIADGAVLGRVGGIIADFPNRACKLNVHISIPPLPISKPGTYDAIVFANEEEIDRQKFKVIVPPPRKKGQKPPPQPTGEPEND